MSEKKKYQYKTISVKIKTLEEFRKLKVFGECDDDVLTRLINIYRESNG